MKATALCVDPAEVGRFLPVAEPLLRSALSNTGIGDFRDVRDGILAGNALLWLAIAGEISPIIAESRDIGARSSVTTAEQICSASPLLAKSAGTDSEISTSAADFGATGGAIAPAGLLAAASTQLQQASVGKVCVITACGGHSIRDWLHLIAEIETYATNEGCEVVRYFGRRGWLRELDGYAQIGVIADKPLLKHQKPLFRRHNNGHRISRDFEQAVWPAIAIHLGNRNGDLRANVRREGTFNNLQCRRHAFARDGLSVA